MSVAHLVHWAAWAPGHEDEKAWRRFSEDPRPIPHVGAPDVAFLPPLLRRRCDLLSRMMLAVCHRCASEAGVELATLPTVFASRHGSFHTAIALLEEVARGEAISPSRFSHSVHNAQAGLFSIWARNPRPSAALAAGAETFVTGFLESLAWMARRDERVLLVVGDETVPEAILPISDHAPPPHAVALLLDPRGPAPRLTLELDAHEAGSAPSSPLPDPLRFVCWWLSTAPTLSLHHPPRRWTFSR